MTAELAIRETDLVVSLPSWLDMADEQKAMLKQACSSANLNDAQFSLLVEVARRAGLDPFRKHLYGLFFDGKFTLLTGIDGFRAVARRNGLCGVDEVTYTYHEEDAKKLFPWTATAVVYRRGPDGEKERYAVTVWWREFARYTTRDQQRVLQANWQAKGHVMLGKCAKAAAFREGFTESLGGIYERAEFGDADGDRIRRVGNAPRRLDDVLARAEPEAIETTATAREPDPEEIREWGDPRDGDAP